MVNIRNAKEYIQRFLKIRTKAGAIVPFTLNPPQEKLYEIVKREHTAGKPIRIIILKARQMGFSTLTEALIFQRTATRKLTNSFIVTHQDDATTQLFNMFKLYYEKLPPQLKPMIKASNAKELVFENPTRDPVEKELNPGLKSGVRCATAGGRGVGRSMTLQNVHASEFAFWPGDKRATLTGLLQAVPSLPGTMVVIESTANGFDEFKEYWDDAVNGENDFIPVFFAWWEMPEYRMAVPEGTQFSEEELKIKKQFSLDDEQLYWRRWCIKNNCGGDLNLFHQEYPATPDEAFIASGTPFFNNAVIMERREAVKNLPCASGEFTYKRIYDPETERVTLTDIEWQERESGPVRIFEEPQKGYPYVIGGDTAGDGSDWFAAHCINNVTGKLCAVIHHKYDEDAYAEQVFCLGMYFNKALIGLEINHSTHPTRKLQDMRYPRIYVREAYDGYERKVMKKYGFRTDQTSRSVIMALIKEYMRDTPENCVDFRTLGEMLTFCKNDTGKPEALPGEHDDLVMSLAITLGIRHQQKATAEDLTPRVTWTKDQWEDYHNATAAEKQYLISIWGKPKR